MLDLFYTVNYNMIDSLVEIYRLIPDSILFGSILMYFLTQNIAFGIFGIFIFESVLSHRIISWMFSQATGSRSAITADYVKCYSGFRTPQIDVTRILNHDQYPSYGVFSLTSIATYLAIATSEFSSTLKAMGPDWSSRSLVAYFLIGFVLTMFISTRMNVIGCDTLGDVMIAVGLAVTVGALFYYINRQLFGVEAMNFLGLPYLVSKESQGAPIYVCAPTNQST
jgi:hypothetical protein